MTRFRFAAATALFAAVVAAGCQKTADAPAGGDAVAAARAKLSADDRAAVDAQEWCAVSTDERLGGMGVPIKLDIQGQPVFICCKGCKRKAEADPAATLAKVEELKAKAKAERAAQ